MFAHWRIDVELVEAALPVLVEGQPVRGPHVVAHLQGGAQSPGVLVDGVGGLVVERAVEELVLVDVVAVQAGRHPQLQPGVKGVVAHRR